MSYDSYTSSYRRPWDSYSSRPTSKTAASPHSPVLWATPAGKRLPRPASSSTPDGCERLDLARASSLNTEMLGLRSQEREQLMDLNDRFATYIEKVRHLELQNRALLAELEALRTRHSEPSRLQALYEGEARGLRAQIQTESGEKTRMEAERDYMRDVHQQLKQRYEEEAKVRLEAQELLQKAREEAGRAALSHSDAEASLASLCEETAFVRKVMAEEQAELRAQLQLASVSVGVEAARPDLAVALRDVRAQYERLAHKNMQAAQDWYRSKSASVAEMAGKNNQALHAIRQETQEYRRLLQARSSEIQSLQNVIHSLNQQLEELEDTQGKQVAEYQVRIGNLERDIDEAKQEMAHYLREYQDLLNVKMALDIEIAAYRKLLEGEEMRLA